MLYYSETNDWGEVTYLPTTLGLLLLILLFIVLLGIATILAGKFSAKVNENIKEAGKKFTLKLTVKQLVFSAMAVAIGTLLSNLKLYSFPTGGSVTPLSMLIICLPGIWFGTGAGIVTGVAYGILQLIIDPYVLYPAQLVVDYILAFGAMGLSGLFSNKKNGLIPGYLTAVFGRFLFATLSGWLFFGAYAWEGWNPLAYSLAYNAIYIFAEAIITVIILFLPPVRNALKKLATLARE